MYTLTTRDKDERLYVVGQNYDAVVGNASPKKSFHSQMANREWIPRRETQSIRENKPTQMGILLI